MANSSLNDPLSNQKFFSPEELPLYELRDKLTEELQQIIALISVANGTEFLDFEEAIVQDYLWALRNLAVTAQVSYSHLNSQLERLGVYR